VIGSYFLRERLPQLFVARNVVAERELDHSRRRFANPLKRCHLAGTQIAERA
jgi:hypothetical protein